MLAHSVGEGAIRVDFALTYVTGRTVGVKLGPSIAVMGHED